ncbi:hypothetical protein SLEX105133_04510 [Slackia exigua]
MEKGASDASLQSSPSRSTERRAGSLNSQETTSEASRPTDRREKTSESRTEDSPAMENVPPSKRKSTVQVTAQVGKPCVTADIEVSPLSAASSLSTVSALSSKL